MFCCLDNLNTLSEYVPLRCAGKDGHFNENENLDSDLVEFQETTKFAGQVG